MIETSPTSNKLIAFIKPSNPITVEKINRQKTYPNIKILSININVFENKLIIRKTKLQVIEI